MPNDRKRMNVTFDEARTKYYDVDLAERSQLAAVRSVVQQGGANESYNSPGGGSCGMVCGQMCGQSCVMVCGQMCGMCGIACVMVCGQMCGMCGQACVMVCGQMCGMCGCCGGATAGGQPLKVILVQEQPEVDVSAGGSTT